MVLIVEAGSSEAKSADNGHKFEGGFRSKSNAKAVEIPQPVISVITVTFNAGEALRNTIESVQSQNWEGIEHIVIDGGSNDSTVGILRSHDSTIAYWRSQRDAGIYEAMNAGLSLANGQYVLFLNSGDLLVDRPLVPDRDYSRLLPVLRRNVLGRLEFFRYRDLRIQMPYCHQGILFRNRMLKPFDTRFRIAADYKFLLDNVDNAGISPPDHSAPGYVLFDTTGISSTNIFKRDRETARIILGHFGLWQCTRFWARQLPKLGLRWLIGGFKWFLGRR
jgi:glycosyltransferase involved in cell wall biosynthesis